MTPLKASFFLPLKYHHHHHHTTHPLRKEGHSHMVLLVPPQALLVLWKAPSLAIQESSGLSRNSMHMKRNEELLSFGSDPVITTRYRFQGKAAVVCTGEYTWSSHRTRKCICTSQGLQTQISSHYSTWGA